MLWPKQCVWQKSDKHLPGFDEKIWTEHFPHWRSWEPACSLVLRLIRRRGGEIERICFESRNFLFKTINRKRGKDQCQNSLGGKEKYGNEFKQNVFLSLEMVLFFCSLINQPVPASLFKRGKGEQKPGAWECESEARGPLCTYIYNISIAVLWFQL